VIRVADMLAHYRQGRPVDRNRLIAAASEAGVDDDCLRALMYEGAAAGAPVPRSAEPSPLSSQQRQVLRGLAEGKVYKEIARDMDIAASTVRTHLHVAYRKLGVVDRAQAVLRAAERGWI
jgi:DNA-binding NarL/FixJ family response regulator